ncbi:MAG: hypothetical protein JW751_17260 [Polyangiaceae bacterium]|nr:hypothetical protein [Polyangiaceae bacterium]
MADGWREDGWADDGSGDGGVARGNQGDWPIVPVTPRHEDHDVRPRSRLPPPRQAERPLRVPDAGSLFLAFLLLVTVVLLGVALARFSARFRRSSREGPSTAPSSPGPRLGGVCY